MRNKYKKRKKIKKLTVNIARGDNACVCMIQISQQNCFTIVLLVLTSVGAIGIKGSYDDGEERKNGYFSAIFT